MLCGISQHITQKQCGTQILTGHSPSASSAFTSFISLAILSKTCGPLGLTAIRCYTQLVQNAQAVSQSLWISPTKQLIAHLQHWSLPQLLTNTSALHGILWPHLNGGTASDSNKAPGSAQHVAPKRHKLFGWSQNVSLANSLQCSRKLPNITRTINAPQGFWTFWTPI